MEYSCFTSYGQLEYASGVPDAEKIYESIRASYTDRKTGIAAIDLTPGTYHEAKIYARAMAIADGLASIRRSANQAEALKADEAIPELERVLRMPPRPNATIEERRAAVAARVQRSRGNRREALEEGLSNILGSALIAVRPIDADEATLWPADPSLGPGVFGRPEQQTKTVRIVDAVTATSGMTTVTYENWDPTEPPLVLAKGDELAVQTENIGQAEKVVVDSVSGVGASRAFRAAFTKAHDEGASATTGPAPAWITETGHLFIIVTHEAAVDAELVDAVNAYLTRVAKGGITWSIVEPTTPGADTIGPFTLDTSPLGIATIGEVAIVPALLPVFIGPIPARGPIAGGTACTLYGRNLLGTTDVQVDGGSVPFAIVGDSAIEFTSPPHGAGDVSVAVTAPAGTTTNPIAFQYF